MGQNSIQAKVTSDRNHGTRKPGDLREAAISQQERAGVGRDPTAASSLRSGIACVIPA
jgi:hypothetical protein